MDENLLKQAVEDALLRLHPGITYRMGKTVRFGPDSLTLEIGSEGKKEALIPQLQRVESKFPVTLEGIDWGWDSGDLSLSSSMIQNPDLPRDPLAGVTGATGSAAFPLQQWKFWLRYLSFLLLTTAFLISAYQRVVHGASPFWDLAFFVTYISWLFLINGMQFDPRGLTRKIDCEEDGLEVTFWFRKIPVRLRWTDIWGLDFKYASCIIRGYPASLRIALHENSGYKEKNIILKTIVDRSSLRFVEGRFWMPWYRQVDAPDA
jgi:hypothetical protein